MAGPWEKYAAPAPAAAADGPWSKYQGAAPKSPADDGGILSDERLTSLSNGGAAPLGAGAKPGYVENLADASRRGGAAVAKPVDAVAGVGEAALQALTGAVAPLPAAVDTLFARMGLTDPNNPTADYGMARDKYTYAPKTPGGKAVSDLGAAAMQPLGDALTWAGGKAGDTLEAVTGSPQLGTDARQMVPDMLGLAAGGRAASPRAAPKPKAAAPVTAVTQARAAGFKLLPSEAGGGRITQALEAAGGAGLKKSFGKQAENQRTKLATQELGTEGVDAASLAKRREGANAKYEAIGTIGKVKADDALRSAVTAAGKTKNMDQNPRVRAEVSRFEALLDQTHDADSVLTKVRELRQKARNNNAPVSVGKSPDPKKQELAKSQTAIADALDDWLERNAEAVGDPKLVADYRDARKTLAQIASVERASAGGKVKAGQLGKQADKGVPVSGRLGIAAKVDEYFPESTGGNPAGPQSGDFITKALQLGQRALVEPVVGKFLQSDTYQNRLGKQTQDFSATGPLGEFFQQPQRPARPAPFAEYQPPAGLPATGASAMSQANQMAGDLALVDEVQNPVQLPPTPDRLTADTPPPVRGDVSMPGGFEGIIQLLASELGLAPDFAPGSLPGGASPRASGMAAPRDGGQFLFPELDAVQPDGRGFPDELSLVPDPVAPPPQLALPAPGQTSAIPLRDNATVLQELAKALGLTPDVRAAGTRHPARAP